MILAASTPAFIPALILGGAAWSAFMLRDRLFAWMERHDILRDR